MNTTNLIVLLISITLFISLMDGSGLGPSLLWSLFSFGALLALRHNGLLDLGILALSVTGMFHFARFFDKFMFVETDKKIICKETLKEDYQDMGA